MNNELIDLLGKISKEFMILASEAKRNPAVTYPRTAEEYSQLSDEVMDYMRNNAK
jgi:hypothetical protein